MASTAKTRTGPPIIRKPSISAPKPNARSRCVSATQLISQSAAEVSTLTTLKSPRARRWFLRITANPVLRAGCTELLGRSTMARPLSVTLIIYSGVMSARPQASTADWATLFSASGRPTLGCWSGSPSSGQQIDGPVDFVRADIEMRRKPDPPLAGGCNNSLLAQPANNPSAVRSGFSH